MYSLLPSSSQLHLVLCVNFRTETLKNGQSAAASAGRSWISFTPMVLVVCAPKCLRASRTEHLVLKLTSIWVRGDAAPKLALAVVSALAL